MMSLFVLNKIIPKARFTTLTGQPNCFFSTLNILKDSLTLMNVEENGICRITMNSIKKRNALSLSMLQELIERFKTAAENDRVRAVILAHNGPCFSAGHDLKELTSDNTKSYHAQVFQRCTELMNLIQDIPTPVIAEVNGIATAAGCQLVATCDIAVATHTSSFAVPGVLIGLFCSTPGVALARSIHRKQALKMLFTGDPITAQEALSYGLINEIVSEEKLQQTSKLLASRITRHSRHVIGIGKATFYRQIKENRDNAYCLAEKVMVENLEHVDAQEGILSFFQKRPPKWIN
uniref:Enoyl-CoA hydratase domain-containing protein 3, mitochondrial n=1 Tax=Hydra vulgaris TaxID=6087 RepID=T2M858_HYDVU